MSRIADYLIGIEEETAQIGKNLVDNAGRLSGDPEGFELELTLAISKLNRILEDTANPKGQFTCVYCSKKVAKDKGRVISSLGRAAFTCLPCE